jgi:enoyl-CoA hydratase
MSLVRTEIVDRVATLTLADPDHRNALSHELVEELVDTVQGLEKADVGALVITGEGPAFCAGADLTSLEQADGPAMRRIYRGFEEVFNSPIPSVAAINGSTVGAGFNLAMACDVRIAAESAFFDTGFLKLNLHPGGGHTWLLVREIDLEATFALTIFGETLDGRQAERVGLVWKCVPDDEVLPMAHRLASYAASQPPQLVAQVKQTITDMIGVDTHPDAVDLEFERQMWSVRQSEFKEALAAMKARISSKPPEN